MLIDPKVAMAFNVVVAILMATVADSADLTAVFGDRMTNLVIHACAYLGAVIAAINAVLHGATPPSTHSTAPPSGDRA